MLKNSINMNRCLYLMIKIFLDSGAFSAWTQKKEIDINSYLQFCLENLKNVEFIANLDVIPGEVGLKQMSKSIVNKSAQVGWENYKFLLRNGIPKNKLIPIFHQEEDFKWLRRMVRKTDYIGISPANDRSTSEKKVWLNRCMKYVKKVKIHGFGLTSIPLITKYPWYSVDSASWMFFSKYGAILVPRTKHNKLDYTSSPLVIFISNKSPKIKKLGKHFNQYTPIEQKRILNYIESKELTLGKSKFINQKEIIEEAGVCNDHKQRDLLNLYYYLDFEKNCKNRTKVWFAGNFPQMKDIEKERAVKNQVLSLYPSYRRLISFYFKKDIASIIDLKKEELNESKNTRLIKRIKHS